MRILVVDDEPDIREVPSEWLSGQGYQVRALNDESEVLTVLGHGRYDVVILDLVRPKANGLALISHIQSLSPNTKCENRLAKPGNFRLLRQELIQLKSVSELETLAPGLRSQYRGGLWKNIKEYCRLRACLGEAPLS